MAKHQIIYTSCMRGMEGVNDGQQIFSYDEGFRESKSDEVKSLFTYQAPSLEPGVVMTDELALSMPQSFSYQTLAGGRAAFSLNTYLGRDYMGSMGRFGNYLSHSILCDMADLTIYPCELYQSVIFRSGMEYSEVNNPKPPAYLPEPRLLKGDIVHVDSITEFLGTDERMDVFKNMLHAMLLFEKERKRLIICDEYENIIMWIAAMEYTLPLRTVRGINYTTYAYDPELSSASICGVVSNGSKYNVHKYVESGKHFVFDLIDGITHDFGECTEFAEFADTALSFSYDSLQAFHYFLTSNFNYIKATDEIYSAYTLYTLRTDGIDHISKEAYLKSLSFEKKYATDAEAAAFVQQLLREATVISGLDNDYILAVTEYLLESYEVMTDSDKDRIKRLVTGRILNLYGDDRICEDEFLSLYDTFDKAANQMELNYVHELMRQVHRDELLNILYQGVPAWKIDFIKEVLCNYIKANELDKGTLSSDQPTGALIAEIIGAVYSSERAAGARLIRIILDEFAEEWKSLIHMTFNLEDSLIEASLEDSLEDNAIDALWKHFCKLAASYQFNNRKEMLGKLVECKRIDPMYGFYVSLIAVTKEIDDIHMIYSEYRDKWLEENQAFAAGYSQRIYSIYYQCLVRQTRLCDRNSIYKYYRELLTSMIGQKIQADFTEELILKVIHTIPLERPNKEDESLLEGIFTYSCNDNHHKISGKLLLLLTGLLLDKIKSRKELLVNVNKVNKIAASGFDLTKQDGKTANRYLEWILPPVLTYTSRAEDMKKFYELFQMTANTSNDYFRIGAKEYLNQSKDNESYKVFYQYLLFMFECGDKQDGENTAKALSKLGKQKLETLNSYINQYYAKDTTSLKRWSELFQEAQSANPLLNNIANIFKRKKVERK